jgi:hypothetical protein
VTEQTADLRVIAEFKGSTGGRNEARGAGHDLLLRLQMPSGRSCSLDLPGVRQGKETAEGSRLGQDGVVSGFLDVQQGDIIHVTRGDRSGDVRVTKVTPGGGHSVTIETEPLAGPDPGLPIPNDDPRCHCALEPDRPVADGMTVIDIAEGRAALHSDCPHHGPVARQMLRAVMPGNSFSVAPGAAQARLDP